MREQHVSDVRDGREQVLPARRNVRDPIHDTATRQGRPYLALALALGAGALALTPTNRGKSCAEY